MVVSIPSVWQETGNDADAVTTTFTVSVPLSFYEGVADCKAGRTVPLDVALACRPSVRFKPWQLVGPLGVLR